MRILLTDARLNFPQSVLEYKICICRPIKSDRGTKKFADGGFSTESVIALYFSTVHFSHCAQKRSVRFAFYGKLDWVVVDCSVP